MGAKDYYLGSVQEALSYEANALMLYTGAPQNSVRTPLEKLKIEEAKQLLKEHDIPLENVIIHAPYLINLANTVNPDTFENSKKMLGVEIERSKAVEGISHNIIDNAKVIMDATKMRSTFSQQTTVPRMLEG